MQKTEPSIDEAVLAELKRLLVFALLRMDASQKDVAAALGVDQSQVSRMLTKGKSTTKARR